MPLSIDLTARKALVTGVTSGIGAAIATAMARAGCDVAGCALEPPDAPSASEFLKNVNSDRRRGFYHRVDLSSADGAARWVTEAANVLGGIDIVVSNAGQNIFRGASQCSEEDWSKCINLDLASHWRLAKAAYPHLTKSANAVVILMSSTHAGRTLPGCFPYNVAKAGVNAMVQSLAIEWGPRIRAIGVAPGFIDTPGNDAWFNSFPDPAAERAKTESLHPIGRLGRPNEIAALCSFLATDLCGFITGTTLLIDGGRSALLQDK